MRLHELNIDQTAAVIEAASLLADEAHRLGGELLEDGLLAILTYRKLSRATNVVAETQRLTKLDQAVQEVMAAPRLH